MFRFQRVATIKLTSNLPKAVEFSMKVGTMLKENYDLNISGGVEVFGQARVHWYFDVNSLDALTEINGKLLADPKYNALIEEYGDIWVEGSSQDTIVKMMG